MQTKITKEPVVTSIRFYVTNPFTTQKEIDHIRENYPRPFFYDEDAAYYELNRLISHIQAIPSEGMRVDAIRNFISYNVAELFLSEAPSYRLFHLLKQSELQQQLDSYFKSRNINYLKSL